MLTVAQWAGLIVLVSAHLVGGRMPALLRHHHRRWLSFFGGVAVAYVFVHLLPELGAGQEHFEEHAEDGLLAAFERHVYLVALVGLVVFYGAEGGLRRHRRELEPGDPSTGGGYWLHVGTFAAYNVLIGYLLVDGEDRTAEGVFLYTTAMFLHFLVVDFGLAEDHQAAYRTEVRWLLALAVATGGAIGWAFDVSHLAVAALTAFLAGGVLLNILKEELPEEENSDFVSFLSGTASYTALLLAT